MRRILIIVYAVFLAILLMNFLYYKALYDKQQNYVVSLLNRQVLIVGLTVDSTNNYFISDLNEINFSEDIATFFTDPKNKSTAEEKMKIFFSKYQAFVTGIKLFDRDRNEYTLKRDGDTWLPQQFTLHAQGELFNMEKAVQGNREIEYYLPVIKNNTTVANIVVTVDYMKYFNELFEIYALDEFQWQWVVTNTGEVIYNNNERSPEYQDLERITGALAEGSNGSLVHKADIDGTEKRIISSYYSTQLLQRDLGLVFSIPTDLFQNYIIRNSVIIVSATLILILLIIFLFRRFMRTQYSELKHLKESEKMLFKIIDDMPAGIVIHNKKREIIKVNRIAASMYAYSGEEEMTGKIFPETTMSDASEYFARNLGPGFNPNQFVIIKKEKGETVLFRNSIPVVFRGEDATMETLTDVTSLELARQHEARANLSKSEFMARISYEIRTPLNGIIGMADLLSKNDLSPEVKNIVTLLHSSTDILLSIINDLNDFSKIEAGNMVIEEIPLKIRDEIKHSIELAKTKIAGNDVNISFNVSNDVPESIIGDPFRLRQILINLLNNSIRNTPVGEIRLECAVDKNDAGVLTLGFTLMDSGIRFDKATLNKIFGEYVNIESKSLRNTDDSGFGTILAREFVELMGGQLSAESPSGISGENGTRVHFTLKTFSNDKPEKNIYVEKINTFDKIKTLIITGSQVRNEDILASFHKIGLDTSVTTFQKSTPAQLKANLSNPGGRYSLLVILDTEEFNGFEAAASIWENKLSPGFIELMVSTNDERGNFRKCITLGVDHYMIKPFDTSDLADVLHESFPNLEYRSEKEYTSHLRDDVRILIVEDNKLNQKTIGAMLKSMGYSFDLVDNGKEACIQARTKKYDLIFMDLIMPEMDGFETSRRILQSDNSVLIVAFTADSMPESKRKAELSGIREFIAKPVRLNDLRQLFMKYFEKN
ncbi:MAG: response regulator [Bacteroidales bacterium]|nr:response regulator [Bacteroidales bacterium]